MKKSLLKVTSIKKGDWAMKREKWEKIPKAMREVVTTLLASAEISAEELFDEDECGLFDGQPKFISKKQAAEIAGVSIDTINRRIKDGSLKVKKIHPGRNGAVRIFRDSFESWLKNNQQTKITKGDN